MKNRLRLLTLAAAVLIWGFGTMEARASTVVSSDGGTFSWSLSSDGAGHLTLSFSHVELTTVNGPQLLTPIASTMTTLNADYSLTGHFSSPYFYGFDLESFGLKRFGLVSGARATLGYETVSAGSAQLGSMSINALMPKGNPFADNLAGYTFSPFSNGGTMNISLSDSGVDLGAIIVSGKMASGTGSFTEVANASVPEPASLALLGIGMTGFLAFRRFIKRSKLA
jgi:hypothetical protein